MQADFHHGLLGGGQMLLHLKEAISFDTGAFELLIGVVLDPFERRIAILQGRVHACGSSSVASQASLSTSTEGPALTDSGRPTSLHA